jgi:membrane-bound lytic murein transglycosylase A
MIGPCLPALAAQSPGAIVRPHTHPTRPLAARLMRSGSLLIIAASLGACSSLPFKKRTAPPAPPPPAPVVAPTPAPLPSGALGWDRGKARWVQSTWADLPGWQADRVSEAWAALWRSCAKPPLEWASVCTQARSLGVNWGRDAGDATVRMWLEGQLQPWRIESQEGQATGLLTGYFEPMVEARRKPQPPFTTPLHRPPADLGKRKPYLSRADLETTLEGKTALAGRELVHVADPLDALLVQVQGSTRVKLIDEPDAQGNPKVVRLAFAGHNDQPYQSVARWLVDQGAFPLDQASWPSIKAWAQLNPQRVSEMLRANPRVVFFKEEPLLQADVGPQGAQGLPLTPGRSVAVDKDTMPYGTLLWLDSTEPQPWSATPPTPKPMQRLVVAQDTGGAIVGAVRADYFWGWGDEALLQAGRTKQALRLWALWPR